MVTYKFTDNTEINNAPMSTGLLAKLQKDILTGRFQPGEKLTEQALCKEYGVSRTPIREALRQLEENGLVENRLNRGAFVIGLTEQDYEDMFELRKAYEVQAVKWAIERITDEEMEKLEEIHELVRCLTNDTIFMNEHASNLFHVKCRIPEAKEELLRYIEQFMENNDEKELRKYRERITRVF